MFFIVYINNLKILQAKDKKGNNVYFTKCCIILKRMIIDDNFIIGTGSIVNSDIPDNSVAADTPAKVICSLGE